MKIKVSQIIPRAILFFIRGFVTGKGWKGRERVEGSYLHFFIMILTIV